MAELQAFFDSLPSAWVVGPSRILHLLSVVIWVGGMFFAYRILRPAATDFATPVRLRLWVATLEGFFRWVWLAVILLPTTGLLMAVKTYGHLIHAPWPVHVMLALGLLMIAIFCHVYWRPWPQLKERLHYSDWPNAAAELQRIRSAVGLNLWLGILTIVIASAGRSGLLA